MRSTPSCPFYAKARTSFYTELVKHVPGESNWYVVIPSNAHFPLILILRIYSTPPVGFREEATWHTHRPCCLNGSLMVSRRKYLTVKSKSPNCLPWFSLLTICGAGQYPVFDIRKVAPRTVESPVDFLDRARSEGVALKNGSTALNNTDTVIATFVLRLEDREGRTKVWNELVSLFLVHRGTLRATSSVPTPMPCPTKRRREEVEDDSAGETEESPTKRKTPSYDNTGNGIKAPIFQ